MGFSRPLAARLSLCHRHLIDTTLPGIEKASPSDSNGVAENRSLQRQSFKVKPRWGSAVHFKGAPLLSKKLQAGVYATCKLPGHNVVCCIYIYICVYVHVILLLLLSIYSRLFFSLSWLSFCFYLPVLYHLLSSFFFHLACSNLHSGLSSSGPQQGLRALLRSSCFGGRSLCLEDLTSLPRRQSRMPENA